MSTTAPTIFDSLAQQDIQRTQQAQVAQKQPDIFDKLAQSSGATSSTITAAPENDFTKVKIIGVGAQPSSTNIPEMPSYGGPVQQMTMPLAKGLMDLHSKLKEMENFTQEGRVAHPIQAHIGDLANRIEGLLVGNPSHPEAGIGTGKEGLLTNPVTGSLLPGGEGTPMLAEGLEGAGNLAKKGYQAGKDILTGGEGPGIVKQVLKGKSIAQEPAKAAIRAATGTEENAALLEGNKTIVDEHLNELAQREKAAYAQIDEAAGFDVKEAKIRLKNDQYKLKQLGNTEADQNAREKLTEAIRDTANRIDDAKNKVSAAGMNPSTPDELHKSRMAGMEFKKALVRNISSDGETINVDGLLTATKNLRALSKYGDRLEQFLGKANADEFMSQLQQAQKLGQKALTIQRVAKILGTSAAGGTMGGEIIRHVLP